MKKLFIFTLLSFILLFLASCTSGSIYKHEPMKNPYAAADIIKDDNAIYGYKPNETGSLKQYAVLDWTDAKQVNEWKEERIAYHNSIESMYEILDSMKKEGKTIEEIARTLSNKRNQIRLEAYKDDPERLAIAKQRNLEKYGNEEGPQPDELYAKYGSWEIVLSKAFSTNSGMDACLGLYDNYYNLYIIVGQVKPDSAIPTWGLAIISIISSAILAISYHTTIYLIRKKKMISK